ncbi:MAG: hypothetical protein M1827_002975 [Pycnora praestabilis]|nr:MAG: hypothetical protein M1827_002975 [Pycnora praestabilis]
MVHPSKVSTNTRFLAKSRQDAVPKKRGPKTEVLEALLKRVDGLEKRLQDDKKSSSPTDEAEPSRSLERASSVPTLQRIDINQSAIFPPTGHSESSLAVQSDLLLDTYFSRVHCKPYHILDESMTRQRHHLHQLPSCLLMAIYAVGARYVSHPEGYNAAVQTSRDYAIRSRNKLDVDEPSVENLQTFLLLSMAFFAVGMGKKAYMSLVIGCGMAVALDLHRELPTKIRVVSQEREMRRRLFWSCYLMDRFSCCGSKRPALLPDESIILRLPSWSAYPASAPTDGEYFSNGSNLQYQSGPGRKSQGKNGMLIDIVRVLGIMNRYLAAGGVKGDSHFPWHSLSNLSKIRQDLDIWASGTQDIFSCTDSLFSQADSTISVLGKLVYHLIHCLIYRPFLPVDLAELSGTGQHQSWQIEATNLCFMHANAIAELAEIARASANVEWAPFVGYCIFTAGTVHVHGAHYRGREGEIFSMSAKFLSQEMHQLSELRYMWAGVQHQRQTLQTIYGCHTELVRSLASNPMRFSPVFHLEDFFDRYPGQYLDGSHVTFANIEVEAVHERNELYTPQTTGSALLTPQQMGPPRQLSMDTLALQHPNANKHSFSPSDETLESAPSNDVPKTEYNPAHVNPQLQQSLTEVSTGFNLGMPTPFSPFNFPTTPLPNNNLSQDHQFDPMFGMPNITSNPFGFDQQPPVVTPGANSQTGSSRSEGEKDPFLSLLEQLAEQEQHVGDEAGSGGGGGVGGLNFFLSNNNNGGHND